MKRLILSLLLATGLIAGARAGDPEKGDYKVNTSASKIEWTARKVTGKHNGIVNLKEGNLKIKDGILLGGSFTVDMTSITNLDLTGEYKSKLEGHLKSDDFFGVAQYPTATLVIRQANAKGNGNFDVKGDMTIRGITQPVQFTTQLTPDGKRYKGTANITIDRSLYNVKYGSGKFFEDLGDKTIYDEFDLVVTLIAE